MVVGVHVITFLVVVLCSPGECIEGHVPLPNLTLTECFANDPRIPRDVLQRWQVYEHREPKYVPVLAWCERDKRRRAYRDTCATPRLGGDVTVMDQIRESAHLCVGRTVLDDPSSETAETATPPRVAQHPPH